MHKIPVGILGASGYAGRELCGLVAGHPGLSLAFATADSRRGERVRVPTIGGAPTEVTFVATDDARLDDAALVFSALPHGASATWVERARAAGARVVDLSSDLRPGHLKPELLAALGAHRASVALAPAGGASAAGTGDDAAVPYGLPELFRDEIRGADVVANPGCYPTRIDVG
jgi:N-acetyl-gamma-glutamyl-phosphate reductase